MQKYRKINFCQGSYLFVLDVGARVLETERNEIDVKFIDTREVFLLVWSLFLRRKFDYLQEQEGFLP